jgi:hypothetical protein
MSSNNDSSSNKPFVPSLQDTVHFDPTLIGLPAGWSLTEWSTLKG